MGIYIGGMMHSYNVRKISEKEYHVIETRFVNEGEYILAKCSGPVPASDIMLAMRLAQSFKTGNDRLHNAISNVKDSIDHFKQEHENILKGEVGK